MAEESKQINRDQVVNYLNHAFAKATQKMGSKNAKGTELYDKQVEFCYMIDEIQRGPQYIIPKVIAECNKMIDDLSTS